MFKLLYYKVIYPIIKIKVTSLIFS